MADRRVSIQFQANVTPAIVEIAKLEAAARRLREQMARAVTVDVDVRRAVSALQALNRDLDRLNGRTATVEADADAGRAEAEIRALVAEVDRLDGRRARVDVDADVGGALTSLAMVAGALASLPAATTIAVGVGALGAAFTAAGVGAAGFASVAVPSLGRINDALKQQESAAGGAGGATKSAAQAAAEAASRALQLEQAERRVADAQKGVKQAQEDLTQARRDAKRALEDLTLSVKDAALAEEDATLSVAEARRRLSEVQADPNADPLDVQRAELNYRQAVQRLEEQSVRTKRLKQEQRDASRAGVEGSDQVRSAQDRLLKSQQDLATAQKQLTVLQLQQRAAMQQTGSAAGSAASKFAELSKAEQALAKDIKAFQDRYLEWQRSLQPAVFPAIRSGMDLMTTGMKLGTPVVRSSAKAFDELLRSINGELKGQEWRAFFDDLGRTAPGVIDRLGTSAMNVGNGLRGVIQAFLPYSNDLLDIVVRLTDRFEAWGTNLKGSPEFEAFIAYAKENGPKVAEVFGNIATFAGKIAGVGAGLGPGVLDFMVTLSERLAGMDPAQIEAIAKGVGLIFAAVKIGATLKIGALVVLADVLSKMSPGQIQALAIAIAATVTAVKGYEAVSGAAEWWKNLSGSLDKAGGSADGAKGKFAGLAGTLKTGGVVALVAGMAIAVDQVSDSLSGLNPNIAELAQQTSALAAKGTPAADMLNTFGSNLDTLAGDMSRSSVWFAPTIGQFESLGDTVGRLSSDGVLERFSSGFSDAVASVTQGAYTMDTGRQRLENFDKTLTQMVQSGNTQQAATLFNELAKQAGLAGGDVDKLKALLPGYSAAASAAEQATAPTGDALKDLGSGARDAANDVGTLRSAISQLTSLTSNAMQTEISYKRAVDDAAASIRENGRAHDTNSEAGRRNREALIGLAEKANAFRQALIEQGAPLSEVNAKLATQRDQFVSLAEKMGFSRKQAEELATKLGLIPGNVKTDVKTPGGKEALDLIKEYERKLKELDGKTVTTTVRQVMVQKQENLKARAGGIVAYADGGIRKFAAGGRSTPPNIATGPTLLYGEGAGPEAFIPYERRFRERAIGLLSQVADDFGLSVQPSHMTMGAPVNSSRVSAPQQMSASYAAAASAGGGSSTSGATSTISKGGSLVTIQGDLVVREQADADRLSAALYARLGSKGP
ncbi:hypothetical protein ACIHFD_56490 [Nonomuraea sp. NPDC051941]|uniref:hypothetical protein n=1 Tax=Nonomuraea sp. NPDC051941 TaxID=3364373 RepID=UPI0037C9B5E1